MKKTLGISLVLIFLAVPTFAQQIPTYTITCNPVTLKGKLIQDTYTTLPYNQQDLGLVIWGFVYTDTADRIIGDLRNAEDVTLASFTGNILWNATYTKASMIGTLQETDEENNNYRSFYLDGTLKLTRGERYILSAKGGETDTHAQAMYSFVASFSKISSKYCFLEPYEQ